MLTVLNICPIEGSGESKSARVRADTQRTGEPIYARVKAYNPELAAAMQQGACAAPIW
jgi:hypothetical protein